MKKLLFSVIAVFVICSFTSAQDIKSVDPVSNDTNVVDTAAMGMQDAMIKMFTNNIKIDVDRILFPVHQGSFYVSDATPSPVAMIMTILLPQSYEEVMKGFLENTIKEKQVKIETSKEIVIDNKKSNHISVTKMKVRFLEQRSI